MVIDESSPQAEQMSASHESKSEQDALHTCQQELKSIKDSYTLLMADFDNYKKRIARDNERFLFNAQGTIILKFLPIIDNILRFSANTKNGQLDEKGLMLIDKEIKKIFDALDIKEVQLQQFDPELHEAVTQVKVEDKQPGSIVDYAEKGYTYKGTLLRPAKVAVAQ